MGAIHRYATNTGALYLFEDTITPRRHTAADKIDGWAIVFCGNQSTNGKALSTIEAFDLKPLHVGQQKIIEEP